LFAAAVATEAFAVEISACSIEVPELSAAA
jgi:hypothetical protein